MTNANLTSTGPIGKQRGPGKVILFLLITIGIYSLYWVFVSYRDVKVHTGQGVGGGLGLLIHVISLGIVTWFLLPSEIKKMFERDGQKSPVSGATGFWILLLALVWYFKCQKALNKYWASKGAPAA